MSKLRYKYILTVLAIFFCVSPQSYTSATAANIEKRIELKNINNEDSVHDSAGSLGVLETLIVPVDGSSVTSSLSLSSDVTYTLIASGMFFIGGPNGLSWGDAEHAFDSTGSNSWDHCDNDPSDVDLGIAIDDMAIDSNKNPNWGAFRASHEYEIAFVGRGAPITANYHDCGYGDNDGFLILQISSYPLPSTLEALTVPVDGSSVTSSLSLSSDVTYTLIASGMFFIGGISGQSWADAEYAFNSANHNPWDHCDNDPSDVDLGIAIDDVAVDFHKIPDWGNFKLNHQYEVALVGEGVPITLSYHDCYYPDNVGALTIHIAIRKTAFMPTVLSP